MRAKPHGHVAAVLGTIRKLGLERLLDRKPSPQRALVVAMIAARILQPRSKLATARGLASETANHTLSEELGVEDSSADDLYDAMDWLLLRQPKIERALAKRHLEDGSLVLCDLTSVYLEGRECTLARHGYSRDKKRGKLQIVLALLCNREGCPVAVEVFEGNTADPGALSSQVHKLRDRFSLDRVIVVGDRGLITNARIGEDLAPAGLAWISALRAPAIRTLAEQGRLQLSLFDQRDMAEISAPDLYPKERLIVCRNPLLAAERRRKRLDLLDRTDELLEAVEKATKRKNRPLRGSKNIAVRADRALRKYKVGKHYDIEVADDGFNWRRNEERIDKEAALDGLYVIRTNVPEADLPADEAVRSYKSLSRVERAFRCLKSVDLKVRPVHHRLAGRVRAHVLLCVLAYYVEWHMRRRLAPILFDDHRKTDDRASPVQPARKSTAARTKANSGRTPDGFPVHSFHTLIDDLATLTRNRVVPDTPESTTSPVPTRDFPSCCSELRTRNSSRRRAMSAPTGQATAGLSGLHVGTNESPGREGTCTQPGSVLHVSFLYARTSLLPNVAGFSPSNSIFRSFAMGSATDRSPTKFLSRR